MNPNPTYPLTKINKYDILWLANLNQTRDKRSKEMNESVGCVYGQGSAEQVIVHAALRRKRGRRPSMPYIVERNPRKALQLALIVTRTARMAETKNSFLAATIQNKKYADMTDLEIKVAAKEIIRTSSSEKEARQRLRDELDYPYHITMSCKIPETQTGREAREFVRAFGGLVMKNGAMVMAILRGHEDEIDL